MTENVDNLVVEHLKAIRSELSEVKERIETVDAKVDGVAVILVNLGSNIHNLDERVSHIEKKLGIE